MSNIFRMGRPTNFKLGIQMQHEDPHQRQAPWLSRSKVKVARLRDASDRCWPISRDSRTKRPRKTKIGMKIAHSTSNNAPQIQGQRSKVKVTRPTNAETGSASYLPNGKAYELQTWYTDGARRPTSAKRSDQAPRSKVKVARSRDASDRCWPISRERNVLETPKLIEQLHTPRAIMRSSVKAKDGVRRPVSQTSAVTRQVTAETAKLYHIYWMGRLTNWYVSGACAVNCHAQLWSWVLARGRGYTVSAAPGGHAACYITVH